MYSGVGFHKRLFSEEGHNVSERVLSDLRNNKKILNPQFYLDAGNMIATNLVLLGSRRLGRGHDRFPKVPVRYGLKYYTRTYVQNMINEMIEQEYITQHLGYGDKKSNGKKTLLVPTQKLIREFDKVTLEEIMLTEEIELRDNKQYLKSKSKLIDYSENEFTRQIRSEVKLINEVLKSVDIQLESALWKIECSRTHGDDNLIPSIFYSPPLEPGQSKSVIQNANFFNGFRRIFTGSDFAFGGRYFDIGYDSYQNLSKQTRKNIIIEGEPTVELDFSNMFLSMLYHTEGIDYQSDGYVIEGYDRDDVKEAVNIVFNTTNNKSARCALMNAGVANAKCLIELIEKKHSRLEKYFYTVVANELMRKESDIATSIMIQAIDEGIVSLPIHDSFIIQQKYSSQFEGIMNDVYREKFKFNPRIKSSTLIN
jgi:hypothetical protein